MITVGEASDILDNEVSELLRPLGYERASSIRWRRVTDDGLAEVERWMTPVPLDEDRWVRYYALTCEAVPAGWWRYVNRRNRRAGEEESPLEATPGPPMADHAYVDVRSACSWALPNDDGENVPPDLIREADIERIRAGLSGPVEALGRAMIRLVDPGRYLESLRDVPHKTMDDWIAVLVLAAEHGRRDERDEAIAHLTELYRGTGQERYMADIIADACRIE